MTGIAPNRIALGTDFKIGKTTNTPKADKTIDLTLLSKDEDLSSINKFIENIEKSDEQSLEIKNWTIKVADQYIDISANPQKAIKLMKELKSSIENGAKFKSDIKLNGSNPSEIFFKEVKVLNFGDKKLGEHDTDGYTLNPLDNTFLNIFTDDSDRVNDIVVGAPLNVFSNVSDAEKFSKGRNGTELILKNKDNLYVVYDVKRKANDREYKSSDVSAITANNFTENHSRFDKGFLNNVQSSKGFIITDDNKTLEIAGQTGVEVEKADYSVVKADMQLRMIDINGIQNTSGLYDWQGTLNGKVSIDIKAKMEDILNNLNLPTGTRVNVDYDAKDKSFVVKLNYEMVSERIGELTALRIKPNENGSLSVSSFGVLNANLNLTDGIAVDARVGIPNYASIGANGSVSMKDLDKISAKVGVDMEVPLTPPILGFNPASVKFGASINPELKRGDNNKHQLNPGITNGNQNVFIPIKSQGVLVPGFVEKKTEQWENSAHKAIAGSIIGIAESMEKAGFILPKELKDVKGRIGNWGTNKAQDNKDKQVINDFVNGKIKLDYDISKQMNLKGFPNANINQFDPNIKFTSDGQKLNIVFDNSTLIASSDGTAKEQAKADVPDGLAVNVSMNLNNTTASLDADAHLQLNINKDERKDFSKKLTEMGLNNSNAQISGTFKVDANLSSSLENTNDLSKLNAEADIQVKASDVNVYVPNSDTRISLKKANTNADIKVIQDGKNTYLNADTKVSLSGFGIYKGKETLASLSSAEFKGKLSYKSVETVDDKKQKSTKTQVLVQGHLDVSKGKYDNFSAEKLSVDGLVAYTEKEGVSFSGSTTETALRVSGHIKNPELNTDLNIKNISGYGKVDFDQNGNMKHAFIQAGSSGKSEFNVSGKINGETFILDSDIKAKGHVKVDQNGEKISLSLKGDINHFKTGDIELKDLKNLNAKVVYDPKDNSVSISSETGKDLNVSGKLNGQDFVFKGDASVKLHYDKATGKLEITPSAKADLLKVGNFEVKDAELRGTKISTTPSSTGNKIVVESLDGQNINFKGKFINYKKETPVNINGQGSIEINAEKNEGKTTYSVTSKTNFKEFQIGDALFKDASLEGKVSFDGQNVTLSGADKDSYLKMKGTQINLNKKDKVNNLDFEAKGSLTLVPDNKAGQSGFSLGCKDVELKKGVINNYLIENGKVNGKIVYTKDDEERSLSFSGLDEKNPQLSISGKLTKTYHDDNQQEQKYVAELSNLGINGNVVFENNKLKFTDLKTDVKGTINGVEVNNIIATKTNSDGSTDISLTGDTDGLKFGSSLKVKQSENGKLVLTSTTENGSLKMGFGSKDDILKILDDLVKINSISSSPQLSRDIENIKYQLNAFSTLNMKADMQNFNVVYDPKEKHLELTSDLKGQIGSKVLINHNTASDINLKNVDVEGKLTANTETKELKINDGVMKGTTDNVEQMILDALSETGIIPKDYKMDKDKNRISFNQGKQVINIDMNKTGIGDDSRIGMKTGTKILGMNFNYKMQSKITIENIAPEGQPPKNVLKIHLDKSTAAGVINNINLDGKGKLFGFIPVNLNKSIVGEKTPYLDFIEPLDESKDNNKASYEDKKNQSVAEFSKSLPQSMSEKDKHKKIEKHLKENNLDSFDNYQKHNGIVQLIDGRTIAFDLSEYLRLKTGNQVSFEIQPSQNVLSGDENEDHFQLKFNVVVNDLGNPVSNLPQENKAATDLGNIFDQIPMIMDQTTVVLDQTNKITGNVSQTTSNIIDKTAEQVNNGVAPIKTLNGQIKSTTKQIKR